MKKFLTLICLLVCVLGLTACGSDESLTEIEQQKLTTAQTRATTSVIPAMQMFTSDDYAGVLDGYNAEEVEYVISQSLGFNTDGYAFLNAVSSFESAKETVGEFTIGNSKAEINGDQIVVYVDIDGEKKDAQAEVIFSNDMFLVLESAALNPSSTVGELMGKAALNTVIGMGTVFIVLIVISYIIGLFKFIPDIQKKFEKKPEVANDDNKNDGIEKAVAQIQEQEELEEEDTLDDSEIMAVISAAIAAYESDMAQNAENLEDIPADGFVVRSIRKVARAR